MHAALNALCAFSETSAGTGQCYDGSERMAGRPIRDGKVATERETRFGSLLRRYRRTAGLTQEELAERAGLSRRAISDLERGERTRPHPATIELLATALRL